MPRSVQNYRERTTQDQETQLLTFNSDFRQLRYGARKPLITRDIPDADSEPFSPPAGDFLLRGGALQPIRSATDAARLTKYFASVDGLLFTAKQNQLARGGFNPFARDEKREGTYVPTSTILAATFGANNGIHLNKQGLNPFALTDGDGGRGAAQGRQNGDLGSGVLNFLNNLGGGRPFYLSAETNPVGGFEGEDNKLFGLLNREIGSFVDGRFMPATASAGFDGATVNLGEKYGNFPTLARTSGSDAYSISLRTGSREGFYREKGAFQRYNGGEDFAAALTEMDGKVVYSGSDTPVEFPQSRPTSSAFFWSKNSVSTVFSSSEGYNVVDRNVVNEPLSQSSYLDPNIKGRQDLNELSAVSQPSDFFVDFRRIKNENHIGPDYNERNIEDRVGLGNPGLSANTSSYQNGKRNTADGSLRIADKVNYSPIYSSGLGPDASRITDDLNDLVKFRIAAVDSEDPSRSFYMHFRSYIDSFQDNYNADWQGQRFMGRGENFYKYQGFDRDIAMSFTVAASSKPELMRMYHKLNYLASNLTPDFTKNGYMSGPIVRLTVGGYLYEQYGFIQSLNYQIPQDSPWEIAIPASGRDENNDVITFSDPTVKEMPHILQVTGFQFKPIHNFVPQKQSLSLTEGNAVGRFGDERYIALSNGFAYSSGYRNGNYNRNG